MDSLEIVDNCNQTLFDFYDSYLQDCKQLLGYYLKKYREEFIYYVHDNAQLLVIGIVIYMVLSYSFYYFIMRTKLVEQIGSINNIKSALFVISHPDDECMFFGPTILSLVNMPGANVYLLCLSIGNFQSLGKIRKEELYNSCKILGIPEAHIQIINSTTLPDNPKLSWDQEVVGEIILRFLETYSIDTVITFDRYGVSYHPNHASIFYAIAYLCLERKLPRNCMAYTLESVSIIRKYIAYLDIPLTCLVSSKKYIVPIEKRNVIRQAMKAHRTQYLWFRMLYMLFSRYVFINSFKEVNVLELELDLELDGHEN